MMKNKKHIAATLAIMLGTFTFAGCTKDVTAGVTGNSAETAQVQTPIDANGKDVTSSATGGKENSGEKGPKGDQGITAEKENGAEQTIPDKTFTLEELSQYDGKDGREAYIAIDGVVYNVTDVHGWIDGEHEGYSAGKDLTAAFESSPHKESTLNSLVIMGKLSD